MKKKHISFSGYSSFHSCPFRYKLERIDKVGKDEYSIYLTYGTALHEALEHGLLDESKSTNMFPLFEKKYDELIVIDRENEPEKFESIDDNEWKAQAKNSLSQVYEWFDKNFPGYEVVSAEEELIVPIKGTNDWYFKGYIDLVIHWNKKYLIIDHKTTSWGWRREQRSDEMKQLQLQLYKHFFIEKHNIEKLSKVNCGFLLHKRTAKKDNLELVRVSGSKAKLNKAAKQIRGAVKAIDNKLFMKNKWSCTAGFGCPFYQTKHCPEY